jgi:hypothetical protein
MDSQPEPQPTPPPGSDLVKKPVQRIPTDSGMRFGISEPDFDRWMGSIPDEDLTAFVLCGGDKLLAKFMFAYHYFVHVEGEPMNVATVVRSYAAAANVDAVLPETRVRAARAWEHDAVKELLDRFASRGMKAARLRVWLRYSNLVEQLIDGAAKDDATLSEKRIAAQAANAFMQIMARVEEKEQKNRSNRALAGALEKLGKEDEFVVPAEGELEGYVEGLVQALGMEKIVAIAAKVHEQESRTVPPE